MQSEGFDVFCSHVFKKFLSFFSIANSNTFEIPNLDLSILDLPDFQDYSIEDIEDILAEYGTPKDIWLNIPESDDDDDFDEDAGNGNDPFGDSPPDPPGKERNRKEPNPNGGDRDDYDNYVPPLPLNPREPDDVRPFFCYFVYCERKTSSVFPFVLKDQKKFLPSNFWSYLFFSFY